VVGRRLFLTVSEGLAAFAVGMLSGLMLFQDLLGLFDNVASRHLSYAFAVAAGAVAVTAAPLLASLTRRVGRWAVAATGSALGLALVPAAAWLPPSLYDLHEVLLGVAFGLALGGALVALTAAPAGSRLAIATGLAVGLPTGWGALALAERALGPFREPGLWVGGVALVLVIAVAVVVAVGDQAGVERFAPPDGARSRRVWPVLVVTAVAGAGLAGEAVRRSVVASMQGPPSRPMMQVASVDVGARVVVALAAGAVLAWYAYHLRRAAAARWVCLGFGLGTPLLVGLERGFWLSGPYPEPRPGGGWLFAVVLAAVVGGVSLHRWAGRLAPWDAAGLLVAAAALWLAAWRTEGDVLPYAVLAAGLGLALGAGLNQVATWSGTGGPVESATAAALGFASALVVTNALAPVTSWTWWAELPGPVPPRPLLGPLVITVAAVAVGVLSWFARTPPADATPDKIMVSR
jgi:hypothetical protein